MSSIIIGFSGTKKWAPFAWLIQKGYGIPYSHAYIRFYSDSYERDIIYQASGTMVNFVSPVIFKEHHKIVAEYEIEIEPETKKRVMQFALDNVGKPYGIKACLGLAWVRIGELLGKKWKNPFKYDGKTYVCSELAGFILEEYAGAEIPGNVEDVSPKTLFDYLKTIGAQQLI